MAFRLVRELACDGIDVAYLADTVVDIHTASRGSCGRLRMHAELRLGVGLTIGHKKVGRLLQWVGRVGIGGNTQVVAEVGVAGAAA